MTEISILVMEVEDVTPAEPSKMISVDIDGNHCMAMEMLEHIEEFVSPGRRMVIK
jgi:hypothetical protein